MLEVRRKNSHPAHTRHRNMLSSDFSDFGQFSFSNKKPISIRIPPVAPRLLPSKQQRSSTQNTTQLNPMVKSKRTTPRLCSGKTKLNDRSKPSKTAKTSAKKEKSSGIPQRKQCMFRYKMCKRNTDFPGSFLKHSASAKSIVSMLMVMVVSEPLRKPAKLTLGCFFFLIFLWHMFKLFQ